MMKKLTIPALLLLVVLVLQGTKYGLQYFVPSVLPPSPVGEITKVVAIHESEVDHALAYSKQHETMVGQTSQALRTEDKWRMYDRNYVPADYSELLSKAKEGQTDDKWQPWLGLYHDATLGWDGPVPDSDVGLEQLIDEHGGH